MPRPSRANQRRRELLPVIARAFAELGYRRTTTAELAARCGVQETTLYRLWPEKKAMFIASIDYVYDLSVRTWGRLVAGDRPVAGEKPAAGESPGSAAQRLLEYESTHLGEFGHARIIFAGLSETDDPEIRGALSAMYRRYQRFIQEQVDGHRRARTPAAAKPRAGTRGKKAPPPPDRHAADPALAAWALVGLGTVASIARELELLDEPGRRRLMVDVGTLLLEHTRT